MLKVKEEIIHISELKDGQLAEIVEWSYLSESYVGAIVQKVDSTLVHVGNEESWIDKFPELCSSLKNKVRILKPGTTLEITE